MRKLELELGNWFAKELAFHDVAVETLAELTLKIRPTAIPDRPTLALSQQLLKTTDDTLTFGSAQEYIALAMTTLGPKFTRRIGRLRDEDRAVLDASKHLRNGIAHASSKAVDRMNEALHHTDLPIPLRLTPGDQVGRQGIERYLSQNVDPGTAPRLIHYLELLKDIAYVLEPVRGARPNLLRQ